MLVAKYVITEKNMAIVFSAGIKHSDFRHTNPVSAGFVSFGTGDDGEPKCSCYGHSESLQLDARPELDTLIVERSILNKL